MKLYTIRINYTINDSGSSSGSNIVIKRIANSASAAMSAVSSLFGALSNYTDDLGNKYLEITAVTLTGVSPLESNNE